MDLQAGRVQVSDLAAASANQVVVLALVWFHANGAVVHAHFPQHTAFEEGPNILIHRRQRDGRNLFPHSFVDQLRTGMAVQRHHSLKDHSPLVSRRQPVLTAERAEFSSTYHSIIIIKQEQLLFVKPEFHGQRGTESFLNLSLK